MQVPSKNPLLQALASVQRPAQQAPARLESRTDTANQQRQIQEGPNFQRRVQTNQPAQRNFPQDHQIEERTSARHNDAAKPRKVASSQTQFEVPADLDALIQQATSGTDASPSRSIPRGSILNILV